MPLMAESRWETFRGKSKYKGREQGLVYEWGVLRTVRSLQSNLREEAFGGHEVMRVGSPEGISTLSGRDKIPATGGKQSEFSYKNSTTLVPCS